jgi:hypothetical protein
MSRPLKKKFLKIGWNVSVARLSGLLRIVNIHHLISGYVARM